MGRQRRGSGNGRAAIEARRVSLSRNLGLAVKDSPWISWAYGTEHESYVRPPIKPRTMEQVRMYRKPVSKNIARPFSRNGRPSKATA